MIDFFTVGVFVVLFLGVLVLILLRRKKKIPFAVARKFIQKIQDTRSLDPAHAVLNTHKFFVAALSELYADSKLTAAQKISKTASRFPNKSKIWYFHKLRNKIAHEVEIKVSRSEAEKARNNFIRALKAVTKK